MAETYLTKEGLKKLQADLKTMQKQRHKLIKEVNRAAELGDLSENAEYHAAKERLQHVTTRLSELEGKLTQVCIVDELEVRPPEHVVEVDQTVQFDAVGIFVDGDEFFLTPLVGWSSSDEAVATVDAGVATGVAEGIATITVTLASLTSDATLEVIVISVTMSATVGILIPYLLPIHVGCLMLVLVWMLILLFEAYQNITK